MHHGEHENLRWLKMPNKTKGGLGVGQTLSQFSEKTNPLHSPHLKGPWVKVSF